MGRYLMSLLMQNPLRLGMRLFWWVLFGFGTLKLVMLREWGFAAFTGAFVAILLIQFVRGARKFAAAEVATNATRPTGTTTSPIGTRGEPIE
jgi:hypothetical protein